MRANGHLAIVLLALAVGAFALAGCDAADPATDAGLTAAARPDGAGMDRVAVCHYDADADAYHLIVIAAPAVAAHLAQGGGLPGGAVPGTQGYVFDEACVPELRVLLLQLAPVVVTHEAAETVGSGIGDVTGDVIPVDINLAPPRDNTSGCEAADFAGFPAGSIALIQRSVSACTFAQKVLNAEAAGAIAVVIFNQGDVPEREGVLEFAFVGEPNAVGIPVVGTSFAAGVALAQPGSIARVAVGG